jgi:Ni,Fe-hydrogenase III large subunit
MIADLSAMEKRLAELIPLVIENPAVIERMEGTGRISPSLARDFGLVGPAGRAAGSGYDTRSSFEQGNFPQLKIAPVGYDDGDVLARARVRVDEIATSIDVIRKMLISLPPGSVSDDLNDMKMPADSVGIGITEAWRGELLHWVTTDENGGINRYAIKDPSFNNWTGLAIAIRGNLVTDFPLCNKSFNLSYSGNDL